MNLALTLNLALLLTGCNSLTRPDELYVGGGRGWNDGGINAGDRSLDTDGSSEWLEAGLVFYLPGAAARSVPVESPTGPPADKCALGPIEDEASQEDALPPLEEGVHAPAEDHGIPWWYALVFLPVLGFAGEWIRRRRKAIAE